jgi:hypothetical protein
MPYELLPEEAPQESQESLPAQLLRGAARTTARVGEQIAGAPGDIFSVLNDLIARPAVEKITGQRGVPYEETQLGKVLPTTQTHRKATTEKIGKYIEPQNKVEKFIDDVFQEGTALVIPGTKAGKLGKSAFSALATATGANLVGDLVKDISADEKKGAYAKLGSLFLFSMFDKPRAAKAVGELYKPLAEKAGTLAPVNASRLENNLSNLKTKLSKGTLAPSEKFVIDEADTILSKIKNNKITPEELWATKRSLNEKLSRVLFDIPKKADQARARKLAQGVLGDLDMTLRQTAKQDPKFYKELKAADKAFGTIAKSNLVSNFIEKNLKYTPLTHGLMSAFQGSLGSTGATAILPYEVGKILYRISHSKELAKHYRNVLAASAKEDSIVMNRELEILDKKLKQQEKKSTYRFVD